MSREIKFRAWDKEKNVMLYDIAVYSNGGAGIDYDDAVNAYGSVKNLPKEQGEEWVFLLHHDIMQFTGLKDKNGKEIYEGDIVKLNGGGEDVFFNVDFEDGCFVARVPWKMENSPELKAYCYFKEEIMTVEVIGNIYENPELLNSDKNVQASVATEVEKTGEAGKQINPL